VQEISTDVLFIIAGIIILGVALAKIAEKYKFPHPIPLIVVGVILGQTLQGGYVIDIQFDFIAQLTLATILFYAGLTMNLRGLRLSLVNIMLLATVGIFLTSLIAGVTISMFTTVGLAVSFLIGAILSPTDPAALFSVLESGGVQVKRKLFSILEGEAVFNDATAVILVVTVFEPLVIPAIGENLPWTIVLFEFFASMGLGVILGFIVAYTVGWGIERAGEETNVAILTATSPILAYGLGEILSSTLARINPVLFGIHPGALAAVFAGIFMANPRRIKLLSLPQRSMRGVMKNVSFLFEIVIFILLGYTLDVGFVASRPEIIVSGIITAILVIFVARPAAVFLVTAADRKISFKERFFVSWAGVKGVASAALAAIAVAAIFLYDVPDADIIGPSIYSIVFIVLLASLLIQGLTTPYLASRLGLIEEQDKARAITVHRDATRQALLHLVDLYTEGNVEPELYARIKAELEEEIYNLDDELRRVVSERRARVKELSVREDVFRSKLEYYESEFEKGHISEGAYQDLKSKLDAEIDELTTWIRQHEESSE
jgi:cell volume regulation protein A